MFQPEYEHRLLRGVTGGKKEQLDLRCIPTRAGNQWARNFALASVDSSELCENSAYTCLLRNEFLDDQISSLENCKQAEQVHAQTGDFKVRHHKASYGVEDPEFAITQLAQTTMRSELGKMSMDKVFRERESLNVSIVDSINKASEAWGIACLRYEIRDIRVSCGVKLIPQWRTL